MLRQRILSSLVLISIVFAAIWFGDPWFSLLVGIAALLGVLEFYRMARPSQPLIVFGTLWTLLFILHPWLGVWFSRSFAAPLLTAAVVFPLILLLFRSDLKNALLNWAWTLGGILYLGWMLSYLIPLRWLDFGREWVFLALFSTFAADTAAYFVGSRLGRHPLASAISPGKTWEGTIGGFLGAVAASLILASVFGMLPDVGYWKVILLGCLIGIFAQLGDLAESMLKRSAGVKDAGKLIPGHGGILDRLDSVVFTVVVVYYYVVWVI